MTSQDEEMSTAGMTSNSTRYVPSLPANSPSMSTASERVCRMIELDHSIMKLQYGQAREDEHQQYGTPEILGLPRSVRGMIWSLVLVQPQTVVVCGCLSCERLCDAYLPVTQLCRLVRWESLPMFYSHNRFMMPIGHDTLKDAHDWLRSIGTTCRELVRHFEIPSYDIAMTALSMRQASQMQLATNVALQSTIRVNGEDLEVNWPIFRSVIPDIDDHSLSMSLVDSTNAPLLDSISDLAMSDDDEASIVDSEMMTIQQDPPVLRLTPVSGQEIEPPELAFPQNQPSPRHVVRDNRMTRSDRDYAGTSWQIVVDRLQARGIQEHG